MSLDHSLASRVSMPPAGRSMCGSDGNHNSRTRIHSLEVAFARCQDIGIDAVFAFARREWACNRWRQIFRSSGVARVSSEERHAGSSARLAPTRANSLAPSFSGCFADELTNFACALVAAPSQVKCNGWFAQMVLELAHDTCCRTLALGEQKSRKQAISKCPVWIGASGFVDCCTRV